eukprot:NODE_1287_length_1009_cov_288.404167_g894_i0.p2 GENE.NODE_1287_length_1009_cov_288.404167_g894_i0~~NODE_1287_length_1009_cov_288.404167_g894_i0.p2  ORF type:complete len:155 (-),score=55.90 NODE_1287_length_1009_cov_288.404167_g894_i0:157-621(-)
MLLSSSSTTHVFRGSVSVSLWNSFANASKLLSPPCTLRRQRRVHGGDQNFDAFAKEFQRLTETEPLKTCVVLLEDKSMVALADHLARQGLTAGLLNPSDVQAVRQGYIGMYWDGGHIALEELLAMQTTLLLQHRGINPELYTDPKRVQAIAVKL